MLGSSLKVYTAKSREELRQMAEALMELADKGEDGSVVKFSTQVCINEGNVHLNYSFAFVVDDSSEEVAIVNGSFDEYEEEVE